MLSPRSQELMNKNSHHEFRFASQGGLQIACTRWQSQGPARSLVQFMKSAIAKPESAISPAIFTKEGGTKCSMN